MPNPNSTHFPVGNQIEQARRALAAAQHALEAGHEAIGAEALAWALYLLPAPARAEVLASFYAGAGR